MIWFVKRNLLSLYNRKNSCYTACFSESMVGCTHTPFLFPHKVALTHILQERGSIFPWLNFVTALTNRMRWKWCYVISKVIKCNRASAWLSVGHLPLEPSGYIVRKPRLTVPQATASTSFQVCGWMTLPMTPALGPWVIQLGSQVLWSRDKPSPVVPWIPEPWKLWTIIKDCCFRPFCIVVSCYVAIGN